MRQSNNKKCIFTQTNFLFSKKLLWKNRKCIKKTSVNHAFLFTIVVFSLYLPRIYFFQSKRFFCLQNNILEPQWKFCLLFALEKNVSDKYALDSVQNLSCITNCFGKVFELWLFLYSNPFRRFVEIGAFRQRRVPFSIFFALANL